ncbi:MAG: hypothetical protein M9928_02660 [Anaerolineae bacterium]|nr:hypothetical protein [Anaerolineae bacterium]MCO5203906.1 hypothetical protein [Anaerolineae bacterium]
MFQERSYFRHLFTLAAFALMLAVVAVLAGPAYAASTEIEQCANGGNGEVPDCRGTGSTGWVTGNVNGSKAQYQEGDFLPYRQIHSGLTVGYTYCFAMSWDVSKDGMPAVDYISTYNLTLPAADPTHDTDFDGGPGGRPAPTSTYPIPTDPALTGTMAGNSFMGTQEPGELTMWGGVLHFVGNYSNDGTVDLGTKFENSLEYCWEATATQTVLAWGGHIALSAVDWDLERPSGSPYHASNGSRNGQFTAPRSSMTDFICIALSWADLDLTPEGFPDYPVGDPLVTSENVGRMDIQLKVDAILTAEMDATKTVVVEDDVSPMSAPLISPGDVLRYEIQVTSTGQGDVRTLIVADAIPTYATYNPNSTEIDASCDDSWVGIADDTVPPALTAFPLDEGGYDAGNLAGSTTTQGGGDTVYCVAFDVTVNAAMSIPEGTTEICNTATVSSENVPPINPEACSTIDPSVPLAVTLSRSATASADSLTIMGVLFGALILMTLAIVAAPALSRRRH